MLPLAQTASIGTLDMSICLIQSNKDHNQALPAEMYSAANSAVAISVMIYSKCS